MRPLALGQAPHSMTNRLYAKRHPLTRTPSPPTSAISARHPGRPLLGRGVRTRRMLRQGPHGVSCRISRSNWPHVLCFRQMEFLCSFKIWIKEFCHNPRFENYQLSRFRGLELLPAAAARRRRQLKYCQMLDRAQELRFFDPENPGSAAPARRRRVPTRAGGQIPQLSQYVWQLMNPFVECCRDHAQSSQMGASMGVDITGAPPSACPDLLKVPCATTR